MAASKKLGSVPGLGKICHAHVKVQVAHLAEGTTTWDFMGLAFSTSLQTLSTPTYVIALVRLTPNDSADLQPLQASQQP